MASENDPAEDYMLTVLIEECAEVIQAASKCKRFGSDNHFEGYGNNRERLSSEIGDLLGVIGSLPLDHSAVESSKSQKMDRVKFWLDRKDNPR